MSCIEKWQLWLGLALFYGAFQKKLLPDSLATVAGRLFFYPTWPFTYLSRRTDYWTLMDSHVFLGAAPMSFMGHSNHLYRLSVRAVVNLCDEYCGPITQYKKLGMIQLHLPTIDHKEPSLDDIETAIDFIREKKQNGIRIYVHCKSGHGRSAAIVFCWLLYMHREWTLEETQAYMNEKRNVRKSLYKQPHIIQYYQTLHP